MLMAIASGVAEAYQALREMRSTSWAGGREGGRASERALMNEQRRSRSRL